MRLSNAQLELLRTRPQSTRLWLSIFQPAAIFKARINDSNIDKGERVITYDGVSLGTYRAIEANMTMWVGTTPGGMEAGKIRVRSATSSTITVSENNDINWADDLYLTVFRYWELWPIYPHIIIDPNNDENVIFYKDYNIAYSNQNDILGTYANAGPHRAAWLDPASGQAQVYYSSTGSLNLLGNSLNYSWFFQGATVTGSSSPDPGYLTYNTPGHYVTRLIVSGTSGEIDTTYRYVSIYNEANPPIQKWQLNSLQGSRDEGGYTASIKVFETIPIQEHAVVVIFGENYYGNTQQDLGGNFPNAGDILFVGYVDKDSIEYDYQHSEVSFDATSLTSSMKESSGFAISVKSVKNPNRWFKLADMDGRRALYHYLRWHTTALQISDFQFVGDDPKIQYFDSERESMYDALNNYMMNTLVGKVVSDRQGKVWMEVDAQAYPNPTGSFIPPVMGLTTRDWTNAPSVEERLTDEASYLEYGGVAYSGVYTGTFKAIITEVPGNAPGFYGSVESHQGLALRSQSQLNQLAGNILANKNSPFPTVSMDMSIHSSNLDIAPQETVELNISASDTVRGVPVNGLYIPDSISWKYDAERAILLPTIDFKQIVTGYPGTKVTIPDVSDVGGGNSGESNPPPPIIFPPSVPPASADGAPPRVLVHDPTAGLIFTQTFDQDSPTWYQVNAGLTVAQYQSINRVVICPNGAVYVGHVGGGTLIDVFLARADFVGDTFVVIEDQATINTKMGTAFHNGYLVTFNCDPLVAENVVYVLGSNLETSQLYIGAGGTYALGAVTAAGFLGYFGSISSWKGTWLLTGQKWSFGPTGRFWVFDATVSTLLSNGGLDNYQNSQHLRSLTGKSIHYVGVGASLSIGENNCATLVTGIGSIIGPMSAYQDVMAGDPTLTYLMGWGGTGNGTRYKSTDGGYSWSVMGNLPVLVGHYYACVDASRWLAASSYMYYTDDAFISSPIDKQGNLPQINPLYVLDVVKVVP